MAIDTTRSASSSTPGEEDIGAPPATPAWRRSLWLRPHILWAWPAPSSATSSATGSATSSPAATQQVQDTGQNDVAIVLGLTWVYRVDDRHRGLNYPLAKILGYELPATAQKSWVRYFRMTDDHKVVGWQYAVGVLLFLFTGGLLAMLIRTELLSPTNHVFGPGTYIAIVGEHGTIMMMMASSAVVGPWGTG